MYFPWPWVDSFSLWTFCHRWLPCRLSQCQSPAPASSPSILPRFSVSYFFPLHIHPWFYYFCSLMCFDLLQQRSSLQKDNNRTSWSWLVLAWRGNVAWQIWGRAAAVVTGGRYLDRPELWTVCHKSSPQCPCSLMTVASWGKSSRTDTEQTVHL